MVKKPTYEELEKMVKELEKEAFGRKRAEKLLKENELKLRVSERELKSILCHSPDIIYRLDPKGAITYVNVTDVNYFFPPTTNKITGFPLSQHSLSFWGR